MARERVLVVEDEELSRVILSEILNDDGFQVMEARTGNEAIVLVDNPDGFQAVVTDVHMPGERDGLAVGRHARHRHPTIPVIHCTGRPDVLNDADSFGEWDVPPETLSAISGRCRPSAILARVMRPGF